MAFILLPILTDSLHPVEFGVKELVALLSSIILPVAQLGLNNALFRFYIMTDEDRRGRVLFNAISATALWSFVLFIMMYFLSRPVSSLLLDTAAKPGLIMLGTLVGILDGWFILFTLIYRIEERPISFTFFTCLQTLVTLIGAWILVVKLGMGVEGVLLAFIIGNLAAIIPVVPGLIRRMDAHLDLPLLGDMLHFGLPFVPVMLTTIIFTMADRWLVKELGSFEEAGIYSAGSKLGSLVLLVLTAFRFAWSPRLYILFKQGVLEKVLPGIYRQLSAVLTIAVAGLTLFSREFAGIFIADTYEGVLWIGPIIGIAYFFDGFCLLSESGIYVHQRTKVLPVITLFGAAMNIALNVYLIPTHGIEGAAWATVGAYFFLAVLYYRVGNTLLPVKIPWGNLLVDIAVIAGSFVYAFFIDGLVFRVGAFLALTGLVLLQVGDELRIILGRKQ